MSDDDRQKKTVEATNFYGSPKVFTTLFQSGNVLYRQTSINLIQLFHELVNIL